MVRPFATYRELGSSVGGWLGPVRWSLVVASFVSLTAAGRLVVDHLVFATLAWAFAPALQVLWIILVARIWRADASKRRLIELYFVGHGPWLMLLTLATGVCLIAPEPAVVFGVLLRTGLAFVLVLVATFWCCLLTYAMFRSALGMRRGASLVASAAFYFGYGGSLVGYFLVTGQLLPLFGVYL